MPPAGPLPVLFIHGDHDPYTHRDELEQMVHEAGANAACWRVPEAGHRDVDAYRPEEYIQNGHRVLRTRVARSQ